MIVYVETNFLLELAYRQERCDSCEEILRLAKEGQILLALPAFAAAEARLESRRRAKEREELHAQLRKHIREIARSEPFRGLMEESKGVMDALVQGLVQTQESLEDLILAVETQGVHIPLTGEVVAMARWAASAYKIAPEDALVLESIHSHAQRHSGAKCFVSRDRAFMAPLIREHLSNEGCKILSDFPDAVAYIRNALQPPH